jgi:hypothetical protein
MCVGPCPRVEFYVNGNPINLDDPNGHDPWAIDSDPNCTGKCAQNPGIAEEDPVNQAAVQGMSKGYTGKPHARHVGAVAPFAAAWRAADFGMAQFLSYVPATSWSTASLWDFNYDQLVGYHDPDRAPHR